MAVTILDWADARARLHAQWGEMLAARGGNPSLHPDWLHISLDSWGLAQQAQVAVVGCAPDSLAIVPFLVRKRSLAGIPLRCLELCSNVFSYHAEVLAAHDTDAALQAFLGSRSLPAWHAVFMSNIVADSPTARAARRVPESIARGLSVRSGERSPYIVADRPWNDYLSTRSKKVRANIMRSQRQMLAAGESGMRWYEAGSDWQQLLEEILTIEQASWKVSAGVEIARGTHQHQYYRRLLPWLSSIDGLLANVLYVHERPAAYVLCARWRGWVGQLKTSFDRSLRDAGSRVVDASLERAFNLGCGEYDFLGDAAPHKMRWTDHIRAHEDFWLFKPGLRGAVLGRVKMLADQQHARQSRRAEAPADNSEAADGRG